MKNLLENHLAVSYGSTRKISVQEKTNYGDFEVTDPKSCKDCEEHSSYFYRSCVDKQVSKHNSSKLVKLIRLEDVFQEFTKISALSQGGCCDMLMYSEDKIVLMDMTCSRPQYLESRIDSDGTMKRGKRAIAYHQLEDSVKKLRGCEIINKKLNTYKDRISIFAVREKKFALEEEKNNALKSMKNFSKMSRLTEGIDLRINMGNGFYFVVQKYPEIFYW